MYSLNLHGRLYPLDRPKIMGIVNVTPDSFYAGSRTSSETAIAERVKRIMDEGADMIDLGAYSSRPGANDVSVEEEIKRLRRGLRIIRNLFPDVPVSIDTFRADVARMAVEEEGADVINDISAGAMDRRMFKTVAALGVPYIMMHTQGTPRTMQEAPRYDHLMEEILRYFVRRIDTLAQMGVNDIIVDPGFGFGKTLAHNYELLARLRDFAELDRPMLVGVSRKSMIYRLLDSTPEEALNGTTAVNILALERGAHILRVHDVKTAVEARAIYLETAKYQ